MAPAKSVEALLNVLSSPTEESQDSSESKDSSPSGVETSTLDQSTSSPPGNSSEKPSQEDSSPPDSEEKKEPDRHIGRITIDFWDHNNSGTPRGEARMEGMLTGKIVYGVAMRAINKEYTRHKVWLKKKILAERKKVEEKR